MRRKPSSGSWLRGAALVASLGLPTAVSAAPTSKGMHEITLPPRAHICIAGTYEGSPDASGALNADVAVGAIHRRLAKDVEASGVDFQIRPSPPGQACSPAQDDLVIYVVTVVDRAKDRIAIRLTATAKSGKYEDHITRPHARAWGAAKTRIIDSPPPGEPWPRVVRTAVLIDATTLGERLSRDLFPSK